MLSSARITNDEARSRTASPTERTLFARMARWAPANLAAAGLLAFALAAPAPALAAGGDIDAIDLTAAAPLSYDHAIGGGAYDDRNIGVDVVESLEGGDFTCQDVVTFLTAIQIAPNPAETLPQTIELDFSLAADTTGQPGVAIGELVMVGMNYGVVSGGDGAGGTDAGMIDDGGSVATVVSEELTAPVFSKGAELLTTISVDDLEAGEQVILRFDARILCSPGASPSGNLHVELKDARVTDPILDGISSGNQTIPFKQVGALTFPALTLVKSADPLTTTYYKVGDIINYNYVVTNTGTQAVALPMTVVDDKTTVSCPAVDGDGNLDAILDPDESITCTASYIITQADLDNGSVTNLAQAGATNIISNQDSETVNALYPSMTLAKSGTFNDESGDGYAQAGETIDYTFTVTNTGDMTLTDITVTDPLITVDGGPLASLAPGASDDTTFSGTYVITQEDINAGSRDNIAIGDSTETDAVDGGTTVDLPQQPGLAVIKSGTFNDTNNDGNADVGETIDYSFTVTNIGNVTLTNITIDDPLIAVSGGPIASLAPGASDDTTFSGTYVITQADIDAGQKFNTASVDSDESAPADDSTTVTLPQAPSIELVKTGSLDLGGDGVATPGDIITYSFTVTNTGNVTLTNVTISDPLITVSGGPIASLAPGASDSTTFTGTYALTQADINAGVRNNIATTTATPPSGGNVDDSDSHSETVPQAAGLTVVKIAEPIKFGVAGVSIAYIFDVTNSGNVSLAGPVSIDDDLTSDESCPAVSTVGNGDDYLDPGESITCTASYTTTQADIDAGGVTNIATASAGGTTSDEDSVFVPAVQEPAILLEKSPDYQEVEAGSTATFTFTVTNIGNVTLDPVVVSDPNSQSCGKDLGAMIPGEVKSYDCTVTVTADFVNVATVSGSPPVDETDPPQTPPPPTEDTDEAVVELLPSIEVTKDANTGTAISEQWILYTATVANTGGDPVEIDGLTDTISIWDNVVGGSTYKIDLLTGALTDPLTDLPKAAPYDPFYNGATSDPCSALNGAQLQPGESVDCTFAIFIDPPEYEGINTIFHMTDTVSSHATEIGPDGSPVPPGPGEEDPPAAEDGDSHTVDDLPPVLVTKNGGCTLDEDVWRRIYSQSPSTWPDYEFDGTNPGQFAFWAPLMAPAGDTASALTDEMMVEVQMAWPFVHQGSDPITVYDGARELSTENEPPDDCDGVELGDHAESGRDITGMQVLNPRYDADDPENVEEEWVDLDHWGVTLDTYRNYAVGGAEIGLEDGGMRGYTEVSSTWVPMTVTIRFPVALDNCAFGLGDLTPTHCGGVYKMHMDDGLKGTHIDVNGDGVEDDLFARNIASGYNTTFDTYDSKTVKIDAHAATTDGFLGSMRIPDNVGHTFCHVGPLVAGYAPGINPDLADELFDDALAQYLAEGRNCYTIWSWNDMQQDPGVVGQVSTTITTVPEGGGDPIVQTIGLDEIVIGLWYVPQIKIKGQTSDGVPELVATGTSNDYGWYSIMWKHRGKTGTYIVGVLGAGQTLPPAPGGTMPPSPADAYAPPDNHTIQLKGDMTLMYGFDMQLLSP